jgi:hypothetical protein
VNTGYSGDPTFLWSNGANTDSITGVEAREYFVTVTSQAGCEAIHLVNIPDENPLENPICLVTVDTATEEGSNLVVWEKVENALWYRIYRETSEKDVYLLAGEVYGDSLTIFTDSVANPQIRSYRYKIAAVDACGNESYMSQLHKTVHLTINQGQSESIINLIWDDYVGEDVSSFEVWRYSSLYSWQLLETLPSNLFSYTDDDVPSGTVFYNVRVPMPNTCTPTEGDIKAGAGPYHHSLSNLDKKRQSSTPTESMAAGKFHVYPNPSTGLVNIWSEKFGIHEGEILISDLTGRLLSHQKFTKNYSGRLQLDLSVQPAGVYLITLRMGNRMYYQKLVLQ